MKGQLKGPSLSPDRLRKAFLNRKQKSKTAQIVWDLIWALDYRITTGGDLDAGYNYTNQERKASNAAIRRFKLS